MASDSPANDADTNRTETDRPLAAGRNNSEEERTVEAYCVKCRAKREISGAKSITMKNGKPATQGICPKCGTKMFRIGKG